MFLIVSKKQAAIRRGFTALDDFIILQDEYIIQHTKHNSLALSPAVYAIPRPTLSSNKQQVESVH